MDHSPDAQPNVVPSETAASAITVYWRPGCGYCSSLFRKLDQHGIAYDRVNIWEDAAAAARVREAAMGNEVVPTVVVAEIPLVNPSVRQIMEAAATWVPDAVPEDYQPKRSLMDRLRRA
jgi:glutaredoxin-like protein